MALRINPNQEFHGNDGPWSSFNLRLGTPEQLIRVLPATSQSTTWVVLPGGCATDRPANCADLRGNLFHNENTSVDVSWARQNQSADRPYYLLPFDSEEGLTDYAGVAGEFGYDSFSIDVCDVAKTLDIQTGC